MTVDQEVRGTAWRTVTAITTSTAAAARTSTATDPRMASASLDPGGDMADEIFRFVNLRGPRRDQREPASSDAVLLASGPPSPFASGLARLRSSGRPRAEFEDRARSFVGTDQYALRTPLPVDIARLDTWLAQRPAELTTEEFAQGVRETLGSSVEALLSTPEYRETRSRLADSLLALTVAPGSTKDKARLTRYMQLIGVLESLSAWPGGTIVQARLSRLRMLLPADVFPLPASENPREQDAAKAVEYQREQRDEQDKANSLLAQQIEDSRQAITELSRALHADTNDLRKALAASAPAPVGGRIARPKRATARSASAITHPPPAAVSAGALSDKAVATLSARTKTALERLGVTTDFVDVPYAVQALEGKVAADAALLFQGNSSRVVTRIGNRWIPSAGSGGLISIGDTWTSPGPCSTPTADDPGGDPTVPATTTSSIRPIGIADLLLVRQEVKRYALGEIAHVENIMIGEVRRRIHREATRTTETVMVETEQTKEESRDLQTTDRFELQQESDAVVKEESSREIALSISASYGPFAEGTANINSSHGDSKETTTKNAMRYAREVTDKAVKKVQDRVLQRRTVTTEHEVEEISKHGFDNTQGQHHVQGIYRWLDKIYEAQVVSYGLRQMFELVVPEPSAFYRYALGALPPEGLTLDQPDPPGYCHHPSGTFAALVPSDLFEGNYQFWVSQYSVSGVEPPPPLHRTIGITLAEEPANGDLFVTVMNNELQVPQGYQAARVWVGGEQMLYDTSDPDEPNEPNEFMSFHVGRTAIGVNASGPMNGEDGAIPAVGHGYSVAAMAVTIEVLCTRTTEAFAAWQLATFNAIIGAYNELKSQYDAALSRLEMNAQSGTGIAGRNPATNRDVERRELKRAAISLLTGQQFDDFDAMRRGVPPDGYPQMSLAEVAAESGYIKFFEQAFEWGNMSYRFYPYFWARKSEWPTYLRGDDTDPLFGQFLQAGAARVQVPVRPGYEEALLYFLQTANKPWEEDDTSFHIEGSLYLSMVDEITNEQLGAFTKGQGTIAVQQGGTGVAGTGTAFDPKLHLDRDIMIARRMYRVMQVAPPTELTLDRPYQDPSATGIEYSFGGRLVGDPWEVRVPTSLVYLQGGNALPDFTNA
jgi:hypothetical protein